MKDYVKTFPGSGTTTTVERVIKPDGSGYMYLTDTRPFWKSRASSVSFSCRSVNGDKVSSNPHSYRKVIDEGGFGTKYVRYPASGELVFASYQSGPLQDSVGHQSLSSDLSYNVALDKLYEKVRGNLDLSTALAESGQTLKMLKPLKAYSRLVTSISPKNWHSRWLEYQYGWRPLAMDIYGTLDEINRRIPQMVRLEAMASTKYLKRINNASAARLVTGTQSESYRTKFGVLYQPPTSTIATIGRFASLNPLSIAWELTPYSFVVDWFLGVGDYLRGLETHAQYSAGFQSGYVTTTSRVITTASDAGNGKAVDNRVESGAIQSRITTTTKNRTVLGGLPSPQLPKISLDLGSSRLISAAALLRNFIDDVASPVQKKRTVTNQKIDKQLENFGRGPRLWRGTGN